MFQLKRDEKNTSSAHQGFVVCQLLDQVNQQSSWGTVPTNIADGEGDVSVEAAEGEGARIEEQWEVDTIWQSDEVGGHKGSIIGVQGSITLSRASSSWQRKDRRLPVSRNGLPLIKKSKISTSDIR